MVVLYSGTPGSGKSYHATDRVHAATKRGINVIANFVINLPKEKQRERFFFCDTPYMTVEYFINFSKEHHKENKESQTLIIIDEASVLYNPRDFGRKDRSDWIHFFSQHRKLGFDIILITQQDRMLDRQIRGQIEYEHKHRKIANFGFKGALIKLLTHAAFVDVVIWYPIKNRNEAIYIRYKKKIANSYDTFATFNAQSESAEKRKAGKLTPAEFNAMGRRACEPGTPLLLNFPREGAET